MKIAQNNLKINLHNNLIMKNIFIENLKTNESLNNINNEIINLKSIIENKERKEERENLAKEIIYNLKLENRKVKKSSNRLFIFFSSTLLLQILEGNNLSTKDFNLIDEKEYFTEIKEALEEQVNISETEKMEVEGFIESYYLIKVL